MPIENPKEHRRCPYNDDVEYPLIKIHKFAPTDSLSNTMSNSILIFIMEGWCHYNMSSERNKMAQKGDFLLVPQGWTIEIAASTDCIMMAFRLLHRVSFCECYMIEQLFDEQSQEPRESSDDKDAVAPQRASGRGFEDSRHPLLKINTPLWNYLFSLYSSMSDGFMCRNYFEVKIKELFYLLRAYYPKDQLYDLFNPVASPDTLFSDYVRGNYRKYKTAAALAASMGLSQSGFARKFNNIFGLPPYQWMKEQKSKAIYTELTSGSKNLKQISADFGFLSPTQFNDFCKQKWGRTPGAIRKNPFIG